MAKEGTFVDDTGAVHKFIEPPTLTAETWETQYPPIVTTAKFLFDPITKGLYPNTKQFARRSDCLIPYTEEVKAKYGTTAPVYDDVIDMSAAVGVAEEQKAAQPKRQAKDKSSDLPVL